MQALYVRRDFSICRRLVNETLGARTFWYKGASKETKRCHRNGNPLDDDERLGGVLWNLELSSSSAHCFSKKFCLAKIN